MPYTALLEQDEDGGFVTSVPALPGCNSQGDTWEKALANISEAAAAYISHFHESGQSIPREVEIDFVEVDVTPSNLV